MANFPVSARSVFDLAVFDHALELHRVGGEGREVEVAELAQPVGRITLGSHSVEEARLDVDRKHRDELPVHLYVSL
jgi:hypothetical protein